MPKLKDCTTIFSNGTEFELFENRCFSCTRYRNAKCRILQRCYEAMWDRSRFPYDDLQEWDNRYGGKVCKSFTDEPATRKRHRKQIYGQETLFANKDTKEE